MDLTLQKANVIFTNIFIQALNRQPTLELTFISRPTDKEKDKDKEKDEAVAVVSEEVKPSKRIRLESLPPSEIALPQKDIANILNGIKDIEELEDKDKQIAQDKIISSLQSLFQRTSSSAREQLRRDFLNGWEIAAQTYPAIFSLGLRDELMGLITPLVLGYKTAASSSSSSSVSVPPSVVSPPIGGSPVTLYGSATSAASSSSSSSSSRSSAGTTPLGTPACSHKRKHP